MLRSPAFNDYATMPPRFSREGGNRSPALEWDEPPTETREEVVVCEDVDGPQGPFLHWLLDGIEPSVRSIDEGEAPPAKAWRNHYGEEGYGGPQPPVGDEPHRYAFRRHALDSELGLSPGADLDEVKAALEKKELAAGTLTGLFVR